MIERRDWPLVAYSGGAGAVTAGLVALTAEATSGLDSVVRLVAVLSVGVSTVRIAVALADPYSGSARAHEEAAP